MKNKKLVSLIAIVLIITLFSALPIIRVEAAPDQNAGYEVTETARTAEVNNGNVYIKVTKDTYLKKRASSVAGNYAKVTKGTVLEYVSSKGSFYKLSVGSSYYYISKKAAKKVENFESSFTTTQKSNTPLRNRPTSSASYRTIAKKGTVVMVTGMLKVVSTGNEWYTVYDPSSERIKYIYECNLSNSCCDISLTISTETQTITPGSTLQLKATISRPVDDTICWRSSDDSVASVSETGVVTGHTAGEVSISASVNGMISTEMKVKVVSTSLLEDNLSRIMFQKQRPSSCKATSMALALNLLVGSNRYTTADMVTKNSTYIAENIQGNTYEGSDGFTYIAVYKRDNYKGTKAQLVKKIEQALAEGVPIVIAVHSIKQSKSQHHWVICVGKSEDGEYIIVDPASGSTKKTMSQCTKTMSEAGYELGLNDYDDGIHYGYVSFSKKK